MVVAEGIATRLAMVLVPMKRPEAPGILPQAMKHVPVEHGLAEVRIQEADRDTEHRDARSTTPDGDGPGDRAKERPPRATHTGDRDHRSGRNRKDGESGARDESARRPGHDDSRPCKSSPRAWQASTIVKMPTTLPFCIAIQQPYFRSAISLTTSSSGADGSVV